MNSKHRMSFKTLSANIALMGPEKSTFIRYTSTNLSNLFLKVENVLRMGQLTSNLKSVNYLNSE